MQTRSLLCAALMASFVLEAAVVRLEIQERSPVLDGRSFGSAGAYERVKAKGIFAIDPNARANRNIVDLQYAPRNEKGLVEFSADVYILRPADPAKGNGTVLFEPPNRGGKGVLGMFDRAQNAGDPVKPEHFGDGFLLDRGYTIVWVGWQTDTPRTNASLRAYLPVAAGQTGLVRSEYAPDRATDLIPLGDANHTPFRVDTTARVEVTVRDGPEGVREKLPQAQWSVTEESGGSIRLKTPATPGRIYEVIYRSSDPPIAGLGAAAVRDALAYLKRSHKYALGFGISQSAMFLKGFLYEGFNLDEDGKRVFDGVFAHVAGARRTTFHRFVQMSRTAGPLRNGSLSTTEQFPFSDLDQRDPVSGRTDGILHRAQHDHVVPKIFYTNSAYEYWGSGGSLIHTTADGKHDFAPAHTTRIYFLAGGQHGPASFPPARGRGQNLPNFNDYRWAIRTLLDDLQSWVANGKEPPPSAYPHISDGTAVLLKDFRFPSLLGLQTPGRTHVPPALDFGPEFRSRGIVSVEPPRIAGHYRPVVPQTGPDGNDLAGIRMPEIACPVAAWTGWNLRSSSIGASDFLLTNTGSFIPLPESMRHFANASEYSACISREANKLASRRVLLSTDLPAIAEAAVQHWNWLQPPQTSRAK